MKRRLLIGVLGLWLTACQALAAVSPVPPAPTRDPTVTSVPTRTPPPTTTPINPTATATATAMPTSTRAPIDASLWAGAFDRIPAARTPIPTLRPLAAGSLTTTLRVFAIGDSVMLGAAKELRRVVAGIEVDAQPSRQFGVTMAILQQRRDVGRLGNIVIVHIGDNGYLNASQFEDLLQLLADVPRVIVVNLKESRPWETPNNRVIAEAVSHYPNAVLVNWHDFGIKHPEVFAPDGIHIGTKGAQAYVALLVPLINAP